MEKATANPNPSLGTVSSPRQLEPDECDPELDDDCDPDLDVDSRRKHVS